MKKIAVILSGIFLSFLLSYQAVAGIVIAGTRVIYPAGQREVIIKLENTGKKPVLMQAWVDDGDPSSSPETAKAPFTLTPPINRMNPNKGQSLRLMFVGDGLPQDKESVFWLNVLEVPPAEKGQQNALQMAFRSRIKIFYRPEGLKGDLPKAFEQVTWKKSKGGVTGHNPSPYYVSIATITSDKDGKNIVGEGGMIAPGGSKTFATKGSVSTIYPQYINDYGGIKPLAQKVS